MSPITKMVRLSVPSRTDRSSTATGAGQLIGALRVPEGTTFTDFRGQEIKPGVYTLRYGQQPQDGNHIGTSELADFLLALPAEADTELKPIADADALSQKSAEAAGSTYSAPRSSLRH